MSFYRRKNPDGSSTVVDCELRGYRAQMAFAFADHMILASTQGSAMGDALSRDTRQPHEQSPDGHLMPINVIVRRACDLSEALFAEMCRREFIVQNVPPDEASEWVEL